MNFHINPDWNFYEIVFNLRALKSQYENFLCSFSYFQKKELIKFKYETRHQIYSLNLLEWQSDKIWEYLNSYCSYEDFVGIISNHNKKIRQKNK